MAPNGDIDILAKSVDILSVAQNSKSVTEDKFKQSGLTVSVSAPVISALQTTEQMADAAGKTKDNRMKALAAATAGMALYGGVQSLEAMQAKPDDAKLGISITVGGSQSSSTTVQNGTTQQGANVLSGGNTSIRATGSGTDSNINIAGSEINAGGNVTLQADNNINLLATQNIDEQHSDRSSSSYGAGVSFEVGKGSSGFGFTVNAAGSRGNSDGKDVSNVLTHVKAGNQVSITSGADTNLIGATVAGNQVTADIGGNLTIASVQDTSTFKSRDEGASASATIGPASGGSISVNRSRVDADYASVGEQSGINAGDGGFQITVKGNTDLQGAKIASTDKAVDDSKNSLTTATLTASDIENRSQYSAESQSASAGSSGGGIGVGSASGSESSTTKSGVSGGAVTLTDAAAQEEKTGKMPDQTVASLDDTVRTGKDSSNSLNKNWDGDELRQEVEAQAKITQAFGQQASKAIGDYAETQLSKAKALREEAANTTDPQAAQELAASAAQLESDWGPSGTLRVLAHTVVGGLTGGASGAMGAAAGTLTAPLVSDTLLQAGIDPALSKVLTGLASTAAGAVVGGTAGASTAFNEVTNNFLGHIDQQRRDQLRAKAKTAAGLTKDEALQLVYLEVSDQISDSLLQKYRSGQTLTVDEQKNLTIYLGGYAQQNGKDATEKLIQNGSKASYTNPYAGTSADRSDYASKNFSLVEFLLGRTKSGDEEIFNAAAQQAGVSQFFESLMPTALQTSRTLSILDAISGSALASGTYLGTYAAGASADTRDGLTLAVAQLAQIGSAFILPKAGISPVFGQTSASVESRKDISVSKTGPSIAENDKATPASSANSNVDLRNELSRQAGIPTSLNDIWGASLDDLRQAFSTGGATVTQGSARPSSSGNAQILNVDGSNTDIVKIQYSPISTDSIHRGQYYKFTYSDGSELKIIDPTTYRVTGWPENGGRTTFATPEGKFINYDTASKTWK